MACLWFAAVQVFGVQRGLAQAELAGSYKAGTQTTTVVVSTWGEDCGPRPQSSSDTTHPNVTVKVQGKQLVLTFPDRNVRTDACWSGNPAVRVVSSSAATTRWRTECQTPDSDAKRERGVYTLTASAENVLELLEESSYDWQLNKSRCVAKVRVTLRVARGAAAALADKPEPTPEPAPSGCVAGPIARLRLRPTELRLAPGERSCFTARGLDAAGCTLPSLDNVKWELTTPAGASATLSGGCFKAAASAAEAEGVFKVVASRGGLRADATVTVASADLSDITAKRGSGADGAALDGTDGDGGASSFGIEAAVKRSSPLVKVLLAALLLALIGALSWFVLSSRRATTRRRDLEDTGDEDDRPAPSRGPPRPAVTPSSPVSGAGEQLICPVCRHGYPGGTTRCPRDGAEPIPYSEFVRKAQAAEARPRTCTSCGAQLAPGAVFCGECGAKVHS